MEGLSVQTLLNIVVTVAPFLAVASLIASLALATGRGARAVARSLRSGPRSDGRHARASR
jgi:hypothetical protein